VESVTVQFSASNYRDNIHMSYGKRGIDLDKKVYKCKTMIPVRDVPYCT
jgi:hypothetical protein